MSAMTNMRKLGTALLCTIFAASTTSGTILFDDDFEDGTLNKWTLEVGPQGTSVAEVVPLGGSQAAHLHHRNYSWTNLINTFDYSPDLWFDFDMAAVAQSNLGSTSADYAAGVAHFTYRDINGNWLGRSTLGRSTSNWPEIEYNNPKGQWIPIADDAMHTYALRAGDLVSQLSAVNENDIATVDFMFRAYTTGTYQSLIADTWVDNVTVTLMPEPSCLMLVAAVGLLVRRGR
jgi:hypothetical protein